MPSPDPTRLLARNWQAGRSSDATDCFAKDADCGAQRFYSKVITWRSVWQALKRTRCSTIFRSSALLVSVPRERSRLPKSLYLLLTTDVLALV